MATVAIVILCLSLGIGYLINLIVRQAVSEAVEKEAASAAQSWATYFASHLEGLDQVLATGEVNEAQVHAIKDAAEIGQVFRFKLFDAEGRLVLVSDETESQGEQNVNLREHNESAKGVLENGETLVMVEEGAGKKNRPPLYSESYVPVRDAQGKTIGAVEVYVDVTETQTVLNAVLLRTGTLLAVIGALAFGLPMFAFMYRNMQALAVSRRAAAEAREHASALEVLNGNLARVNSDLAENMRKLSSANEEIFRRERMSQIGKLTATIAHDLRNPLTATRTSTFLLQRKLAGKGLGVENIIARINSGITRCDSIITQLLDFSRSGGVNKKPVAVDGWLESQLGEAVQQVPENVAVEFRPGLGSLEVPIDADRLQRAIINLLSNASEAMVGRQDKPLDHPTADPRITVSTLFESGQALIRVTDNGPGMAPDVLERIREPLFTTKSFGTGLGVPAIENIAKQHGGALDIVSSPGQGATFTITLPLQQAEAVAA